MSYYSEISIDQHNELEQSLDYEIARMEKDGWKRDGIIQETGHMVFCKRRWFGRWGDYIFTSIKK